MSTRSEERLTEIWEQERREREYDRRLTVYVSTSTNERLVLCGACLRLVEDRLKFTAMEKTLATEGCTICGEGR